MSTTTVTRIAVRFAQILTLALLLVGLAGGTRLTRAAADVDCEEAAPWIEETLDRYAVLADHEQDFGKVRSIEELGALLHHSIDLYADAADEQWDSNPPAELADLNDDLATAYSDVSYAVIDIFERTEDLDTNGTIEATEALTTAQIEVRDTIIYVERLEEDCEELDRDRERERDRDRDRDRDDRDNDRRDEADEVEIEIEATVLDSESDQPIENAMFIVLKEGISIEDFDQKAFFGEGDDDQVLAVGYSDEDGEISFEAEVEIDGEYTVVLAHEDYRYLSYWLDVTFAADDDAETFEFGTVTLGEEPEDDED
jgi:hypothetical protein